MWLTRYGSRVVYMVAVWLTMEIHVVGSGTSENTVKVVSRAQTPGSVLASKDSEPLFALPIANVTAALGREAVLTCAVSDIGDYKVAWIRADDQTILTLHTRLVTHSSRYAITNDSPRAWTLHIRPLKIEDRGCYMCQINTSPMKKQVGCIDVLVPPNIVDEGTSSDLVVREGDDARLTCRAEGRPSPRIIWRREGGTNLLLRNSSGDLDKVAAFSGDELHLTKVERRQMGAYLCIASNDVPPSVSKRILLSVNFPPSVLAADQLIGVPTGSKADLECLVEGKPNTVNYWLKNGEQIILQGDKYMVSEEIVSMYQLKMTLSITEFSTEDVGIFTCVASNFMGKGEGSIRLYEIKLTTTTTSTTTSTTTTTTTTTTTPAPTTLPHYTSPRAVVPLPPAEQKLYTPDVTTFDSMANVIEQSVLDNHWLPTADSAASRAPTCHIIHPTLIFVMTLLVIDDS